MTSTPAYVVWRVTLQATINPHITVGTLSTCTIQCNNSKFSVRIHRNLEPACIIERSVHLRWQAQNFPMEMDAFRDLGSQQCYSKDPFLAPR